MNFFELNEELKDILVSEYEVIYAKTKLFKDGVLLIPETFYETIIIWDKGVHTNIIRKAVKLIQRYRNEINKESHMTDLIFELNLGRPSALWSIFPEKEAKEGLYD
jgi:hypothetical protein